ncbi:MAG TPA: hypothetical protein GXX28_08230 [Firmicutes bacterium]|nr:hypothetical protein [Bacillota bacterium]
MNSSLPYDPFHPPGATRTFTFVPDYPFRPPEPERSHREPQRRIALPGALQAGRPPSPEAGRWQEAFETRVNQPPESEATAPAENRVEDQSTQGKPVPILFPVRTAKPFAATPNFGPAFAPPAARPEQLQSFG